MNILLKAYNNKRSVHALMVFTILCFLVDEYTKLKVLACSFEITNLNNPSLFKDSKAAIVTLKMLTGSRLRFCKIITEPARS
jgi:hypothetical protein